MDKKIDTIVQESSLSQEDKESFLEFLKTLPEDTIASLEKAFSSNFESLGDYWTTLKTKLTFIQMIQDEKDVPEEEKTKIINQITKLDSEELTIFIDTLLQMNESENPKKLALELLDAQRKAHEKFMQETQSATHKLHTIQKTLQEKEDSEDIEEVMSKINSTNE